MCFYRKVYAGKDHDSGVFQLVAGFWHNRVRLVSRGQEAFKAGASFDHAILKQIPRRKIKEAALSRLLDHIIDAPVGLPADGSDKGVPIGNLTSQHFANLYLGQLDQYLKSQVSVKAYVRYMDDMLCFGESKEELV
ncbi:RNA-directed DNA polymerase [Deltaproteobacteria bacterium TL4]